jgi:hypothetical protein
LGPFNRNLNRFLEKAIVELRRHFHGPITYASGAWETVDWELFDFVSVDWYRDAFNKKKFRSDLRKYFTFGKPVVITEFGCCTYEGAADKGAYGWDIVDWNHEPPQLKRIYIRSENVQAKYLAELLDVFIEELANGAFVFTFVMPKYTHSDDPRFDLDMASFALVKSYQNQKGSTFVDVPWEPKLSFYALADYYGRHL